MVLPTRIFSLLFAALFIHVLHEGCVRRCDALRATSHNLQGEKLRLGAEETFHGRANLTRYADVDGDGDVPVISLSDSEVEDVLLDIDKDIDELKDAGMEPEEVQNVKSNWEKSKEFVKTNQKALLSAATDMKAIVTNAKAGNTGQAVGKALTMASTLAAFVPGGQGVSVVLALVGGLTCLVFGAKTATVPKTPQLTLEEIKSAIRSEIWTQKIEWEGVTTLPALVTEVETNLEYWTKELARQKGKTLKKGVAESYKTTMENMIYNNLLSYDPEKMADVVKVKVDRTKDRMCINTCTLLLAPVSDWAKGHNQGSDGTDGTSFSALDGDDWKKGLPSGQTGNPEFRMCYSRGTKTEMDQQCGSWGCTQTDVESFDVKPIQGCMDKVWWLNGCRDGWKKSQASYKDMEKLLAHFRSESVLKLWFETVKVEGGSWTDIGVHPAEKMRYLNTQWRKTIWRAFNWSIDKGESFQLYDTAFPCNNEATSTGDFKWLKYAGGDQGGYDDQMRLHNQPCATRAFCKLAGKSGGPCASELTCEARDTSVSDANKIDWKWDKAQYDYENIVADVPSDFSVVGVLFPNTFSDLM
uniref:Uncharacterized protein n=1 Tax=Chromera velia CCMP2878 TaxID=1169474 RepID=A0A0G4HBG5_9ALVE|eukprot:Cvel_6148.t1-p1 / transcript=Cvel_6148.t1 / gene=Cvel_6148 / organism=Chromera_velia_CCMP2878 / gene_product=hypothetical protein / transcript_product=hypothetical protein / location=Cvel_scaffold297:61854-66076(-) / protein_length=582 / sequence_SO=supercontig / SO=protein_coding / is_pseudo=false